MRTILFVLLAAGCGASPLVVREPGEVVVTAKAPPPPVQPEARVIVKKDRIIVKDEILFDSDRAAIQAESDGVLDEIARVINQHPELVKVRIEGHTDSIGSEHQNQELSERRAVAVRSYLIEHGVEAQRLSAEGFGAENPIAPNDTEDGRAKNRRVVFTILDRVEADDDGGAS
nr:OmpA family protein [Kofleriaceae bacterium]